MRQQDLIEKGILPLSRLDPGQGTSFEHRGLLVKIKRMRYSKKDYYWWGLYLPSWIMEKYEPPDGGYAIEEGWCHLQDLESEYNEGITNALLWKIPKEYRVDIMLRETFKVCSQ